MPPLPSPVLSHYLTVKEAAERVGKSPSSIRRIIYPVIEVADHPDRDQIQPSIEDALAMRVRGENFAWRLNEEFLLRVVPANQATDRSTAASPSRPNPNSAEGELLAMLRGELGIKNEMLQQQATMLSQQIELVSGLSERLREGNILIASLQQRLALPMRTMEVQDSPEKPGAEKRAAATKSEKGSATPSKVGQQKKTRRFAFLFRPLW